MDALRRELAQLGVFCMKERLGVVVFQFGLLGVPVESVEQRKTFGSSTAHLHSTKWVWFQFIYFSY